MWMIGNRSVKKRITSRDAQPVWRQAVMQERQQDAPPESQPEPPAG
jgi:hypothetical protein